MMYRPSRKLGAAASPKLSKLLLAQALKRTSLCRWYATTPLDLPALDRKWRERWSQQMPAKPETPKDHLYILSMFPYPSGNLHLGHLRVYTIADVIARYHTLKGKHVLMPMGWDAFGLPAENAAIERGVDPADWTRDNISRMKEQLSGMNATFDWSREFATCDPEFYKHTQKLFLRFYSRGLVTRQRAVVNWDPIDKTVLANEQVGAEGRSWRSGAIVEQRPLEQWFFKITEFKEVLLRDLDKLAKDNDWPERVLAMQKNWLGKTTGARYQFPLTVEGKTLSQNLENLGIYTTRPETIFGVQFVAISPDSKLARQLAESDPELRDALETLKNDTNGSMPGYRIPYIKAHSPLSRLTDKTAVKADPLPVFIAPYVRGDYETGAVMGVPAHDARDFAFWNQNSPTEEVKYAITPEPTGPDLWEPRKMKGPYLGSGYMTELAGKYSQKPSEDVVEHVIEEIQTETGLGEVRAKWKLRDWLISRQRYWGTPIPIIHCDSCGPQPVPDDQLPVELPKVDHHWAGGKAGNPLESATEWVNTPCPKCNGPAKRDTDTMDTFVDSSWYYMRFADPHNKDEPVSEEAATTHLPVDIYIGGVEHAILHLLYARFFYKAYMGDRWPKSRSQVDLTLEPLKESSHEPFKRLITQGMVHGKTYLEPDSRRFLKPEEVDLSNPSEPKIRATGEIPIVTYEKMSKSKYNGVDPTSFIAKYGADATRAHILFQAPVGEVLNWDENKIAGITRWMRRVYEHVRAVTGEEKSKQSAEQFDGNYYFSKKPEVNEVLMHADDVAIWRGVQEAITAVTAACDRVYPLNTAVSSLMTITNTITEKHRASLIVRLEATSVLIRLMAPITPAFAEECWSIFRPEEAPLFNTEKQRQSSNLLAWPTTDGSIDLLRVDKTPCTVAVNGKTKIVVNVLPRPLDFGSEKAHAAWLTRQVLNSPEISEPKFAKLKMDIVAADKVFLMKKGTGINYVIPSYKKKELERDL
ncbi:leucyl-tRNA synthetase [Xylariaceae sp. FL0255]|nr:leucyl-tRNA synthetase [Xylariaceae sp. FL0255]